VELGAVQRLETRSRLTSMDGGLYRPVTVVGLLLFPLIAAFAPGGSYLAALATGETDRWLAGGVLMHAGSQEGWRERIWMRSGRAIRPSDGGQGRKRAET
jgi:hypothetical protein